MVFTLTSEAIKALKGILADTDKPDRWLKVSVKGGGCSGLAYHMELIEKPEEKDFTFEQDGAKVCVDRRSSLFLNNCTLDYIVDLMDMGFKIINPAQTSECGCGKSFAT